MRWAELEKFHMGRLATVVGDMLLSVGIIAYLGPFSVDYRKVIILIDFFATLNKLETVFLFLTGHSK